MPKCQGDNQWSYEQFKECKNVANANSQGHMVYPPTKKMVLIERTAMNRSKEMWTTQSDAPLEGCSKEKSSLYCVFELSFRSELVKLIHSCYNFLSYMFPLSFHLHRHFTLLVGVSWTDTRFVGHFILCFTFCFTYLYVWAYLIYSRCRTTLFLS